MLGRFRHYLRYRQGVTSQPRIDWYCLWIARWHDYLLGQQLGLTDADLYTAAAFVDELIGEYKPSTIVRIQSMLRVYYQFLQSEEKAKSNPFDGIKPPTAQRKSLPNVLTENQTARLLGSFPNTPIGFRDRTACTLLYATGLRVGELVGLDLDDINWEGGEIRVRHAKLSKDRIVCVCESVLELLDEWISHWRKKFPRWDDSLALFIGYGSERLSRMAVSRLLATASRRAGIRKVKAHTLRHTCATHLVEHGAPLTAVQELLGHASLQSTQVYLHVSREHVRRHYITSHPLATQAVTV